MIDPRPIESPTYWEHEPLTNDVVSWSEIAGIWNREAKKYDRVTTSHDSSAWELLCYIAKRTRDRDWTWLTYKIDASQLVLPYTIKAARPMHYDINYPDRYYDYTVSVLEDGKVIHKEFFINDGDEAYCFIEGYIRENKIIEVEIGPNDPTP